MLYPVTFCVLVQLAGNYTTCSVESSWTENRLKWGVQGKPWETLV
ncbi:hypothetical protein GLYMA_06G295500v4 [Glycine max]|nr:hypothetical protein GLYMA_06G295500v4 [Glycine max]KAH1128153.1 hypothetical protein GYH30_016625 [Glycine max]